MADIEVLKADMQGGRLTSLETRFKGTEPRRIDRATALLWLREGHSLIPVAGHGHDLHRGGAIEGIEVDGEVYLRTDTKPVAADEVHFPHGH
jgi:hypothetical protein